MPRNESTMPAGEFKARCLRVMDDVARSRRPVTITKRGRPVARLVPVEVDADPFLGSLRGQIRSPANLRGPVLPSETWETEREWEELCRENPPR